MSGAANRNDDFVVPVFDRLAVEPRPLAQMIWDTCVVVGPQTQAQLFERLEHLMGDASREHALRNPDEKRGPITGRMLFEDKQEYLALGIKQGLDRGWLKLVGDTIDAADPPPQHSPLGYLAVAGTIEQRAKAVVDTFSDDQSRARRILQDVTLSRKKPTPEGRAALRESLETIGQVTPILRLRQVAAPPIIIDGVTRLELCQELGLEPIFHDLLPSSTTPLEALSYRIAVEVAGTSKGQQNKARDQYIESLAKAGFTQEGIADAIKASRALVSKVLKDQRIKTSGRPSPTEQDVDEFVALARRGESLRAIAAETGWGQQTVLTHLTMRRDAVPPRLPLEIKENAAKARPRAAVRSAGVREKLRAALINHPERTQVQQANAAGVSVMLVKIEQAFLDGQKSMLDMLRATGCTHSPEATDGVEDAEEVAEAARD